MNHCIICKFKPEITAEEKQAMYPAILDLFNNTKSIEGINDVKILKNCVARDNRYDIAIVIDMKREALEEYDHCVWHKQWKEQYGDMLEKKAIFDFEC